jgi:peptidyl-prolyl isomerase H (cyclophilin H)
MVVSLIFVFFFFRLKQWREAIKACDEALKMDGHEPKAFFRKAVAYRMMGQDAEAKKNILQAKRLCSDDPGIDREMTLIEWQWEQRRKREKKVFEGLFDEQAMKRLEEMTETPEHALSQAHPIRFKEDERLQRVDHVSLPGEDDALSKWGGAIDGALPKGDFKITVEEDEEKEKEKKENEKSKTAKTEVDDDDMPPLEPVKPKAPATAAAAAAKPTPAAPVSAAVKAAPTPVPAPTPAKPVAKAAPAPVVAAAAAVATSDYVYDNAVTNTANPQVYLNFTVGGEPAGKVIVELFADRVPKSAALFRKLCEKGYAGTTMSRFVPNYIIQGGDLGAAAFTKERVDIPLDQEGLLCLAAPGSSQFFFTLVDCSHLNGQFVVIGKVLDGIEVLLDDFSSVAVDEHDVPRKKIAIRSAGDFDAEL